MNRRHFGGLIRTVIRGVGRHVLSFVRVGGVLRGVLRFDDLKAGAVLVRVRS